ncbi:hypothetical protein [Nocardioides alkalitolerans]|uniref:hypothetical protein n=1 Tax=Nocardioides alkalitolerans TaxID=281714 RepID=UPI00042712B5|nr:hypothetical protein [Nocardioides alkalitolerans]
MDTRRITVTARAHAPVGQASLEDDLLAGRDPHLLLRAVWAAGHWLRSHHGDTVRPPAAPWAPYRWRTDIGLPAAHRHSLVQWSDILAADDGRAVPLVGPLGLDRLHLLDDDTLLVAPGPGEPPPVGHPAVDLGGVLGDLQWLRRSTDHGRADDGRRGLRVPERLAAALLTSYGGLPVDRTVDGLALARASALRVCDRVARGAVPVDGVDDVALVRALVERAWRHAG